MKEVLDTSNIKMSDMKNLISERKIVLKPVDWLATDIKEYDESSEVGRIHALFSKRVKFTNFTLSYLDKLVQELDLAVKKNCDDVQLKLELAVVLIQNQPNIEKLKKANNLLQSIIDLSNVSEAILYKVRQIQNIVFDMLVPQQEKSTITCVNWGIYNRCPLVCKGCYNIFNDNVLNFLECVSIVDKLASSGVKELIISGGDPLLWEHILVFCIYASKKDLMVGIDTVGYNLSESLLIQLQGKISYLGIPVDGITQKTIEGFRLGKNDLLEVIENNLRLLDKYDIPIRINTTVSRKNINVLGDIAEFISKYACVKSWALYQWWDIRASQAQVTSMSVFEEEFLNATEPLKKSMFIPVACKAAKRRARGTFFISSNGEVYTFPELADISTIIIGDIKTQSIPEIISCPALKKNSIKFENKTFI